MKPLLRRTLLFAAALYLLLGLSPLVFRLAAERTPQQEAAPAASPAPEEATDAVFRIYDEARRRFSPCRTPTSCAARYPVR